MQGFNRKQDLDVCYAKAIAPLFQSGGNSNELGDVKLENALTVISPFCSICRELDATVMRAIASLLSGLPLQPEGMETDLVEAKSQLFLK